MILDSSALIAVLKAESDADAVITALTDAKQVAISAATFVEASVVSDGSRDPVRSARFDDLLRSFDVEIAPFTADQARIARRAYRDYGKGSGHPARLNLGDCFSYALASERREPLLFVGADFAHTDLRSALADESD